MVIRQRPVQAFLLPAQRTGIAPVLQHKDTLGRGPRVGQTRLSRSPSRTNSAYTTAVGLRPAGRLGAGSFGILHAIRLITFPQYLSMHGFIPRVRSSTAPRILRVIPRPAGLFLCFMRLVIADSILPNFVRVSQPIASRPRAAARQARGIFPIRCRAQYAERAQRFVRQTRPTHLRGHRDAPYPGKEWSQVPSWDKHDRLASRCPRYLATQSIAGFGLFCTKEGG
jgi:hypothetical protein